MEIKFRKLCTACLCKKNIARKIIFCIGKIFYALHICLAKNV